MISVVTITFNNLSELRTTLESLKDISEVESVVINGGTEKEALSYLASHSGMVVNEQDQGISDALIKEFDMQKGMRLHF
jgi:glycosyltransferase involved in cell wall biosynthesis